MSLRSPEERARLLQQVADERPGTRCSPQPANRRLLLRCRFAPGAPLTIKVGLPDRFQAGRWLGRGGFGTVYEAYGCERGHSVEVKVLREPRADALVSFKELGREWNSP